MYGFAGLDRSEYVIRSLDEYNDLEENWGKGSFKKFTNLKNVNPNLKTLLAIGGWNEGMEIVRPQVDLSAFLKFSPTVAASQLEATLPNST